MGTINIRIDDELKERSFASLEKLDITPSELLRQTLEYVAENGKLPFKSVLMTDEDAELIAIVKKRLENPKSLKVSLMNSEFEFDRRALKEWHKLDNSQHLQFKKKLLE